MIWSNYFAAFSLPMSLFFVASCGSSTQIGPTNRASVQLSKPKALEYFESKSGMRFVFVEGAVATLGDGEDQPFRKVRVDSFWIAEREVTIGDVVGVEGSVRLPKAPSTKFPLTMVAYPAFEKILERMRKRDGLPYALPTEAQWEFAARSGRVGETYPWGNRVTRDLARVDESSPCEVMSYPPNDFGLYDFSGNVSEVLADEYYELTPDPNALPIKPGTTRISRGGAYDHIHAPISERSPLWANFESDLYFDTGYRLVLPDQPRFHKSVSTHNTK